MPGKKKKYNARFPPARIKKIMQTDEDVGKVAAAVPVIISRALELFIDSLIEKTASVTRAKNAKTLSSSHVKQAIHSEKMFDFLRDLVKNVPDHQTEEEMDIAMPSGSGVVEKKPKVPRPRKPREERTKGQEGTRGRGRPRKAKVEEKKDSESEGSDEETETDEEQTADEDTQPPQHFNPPQGECSTQPIPQEQCNTQTMSQGQSSIQVMSQDQCATQVTSQGQCGGSIQVKEGQYNTLCNQEMSPRQCDRGISPQGTPMQQDPSQGSLAGMSRSQESPKQPGQLPGHAEDHRQPSPVISHVQREVTNTQNPAHTSSQHSIPVPQQFPHPASQHSIPVPQQFPHPGFPMHNMMFPQYPFMGGGQPLPYLHPQSTMGAIPSSSTAGSNPTTQSPGSVPPQFIPGHPAYMMPPLRQNGPMLPMGMGMPGLPAPPPLVPINTVKSIQDNEGDANVPLDMSLAGKSRSQTTTVPNTSVSLSQIPTPHGMPPLSHFGRQAELHQIPHPQGLPQWRMNSQINQNFQETGFRSQISGPPPLVSSTVTQSTATVTENGKHKQSDDSAEIISKKPRQKSTSGNPSEQNTVSFPGLANIMNMKPVKPVQCDEDDYDT